MRNPLAVAIVVSPITSTLISLYIGEVLNDVALSSVSRDAGTFSKQLEIFSVFPHCFFVYKLKAVPHPSSRRWF
jgi:hypothetical protein